MKTAVIGGGIAGLVATYELVKAGYRPVVIEPSAFGGMIRTQSVDGFTLEQGPNVLVERAAMADLRAQPEQLGGGAEPSALSNVPTVAAVTAGTYDPRQKWASPTRGW